MLSINQFVVIMFVTYLCLTKNIVTPLANLFLVICLICILVLNAFYKDYIQYLQRWLDRFIWTDYCDLETICWMPIKTPQLESIYLYMVTDFQKSNTRKLLLRINRFIKYFLLLFKNDVKH
jgi:hypothetical protein